MGTTQIARHLNGAVQSGAATALPSTQLFASPLRFDDQWNPQPYLAERWELAEDGKSLTLHLRENAVFHDGQPITSEDVAFSIMAIKANHPFTTMFAPVEAVETPDAHTAVVRMSQPHPAIVLAMSPALCPILPKHIYGDGQDLKTHPRNAQNVVGSGPFKLTTHESGRRIVMERFDQFFLEGKPYLDRFIISVNPDASSLQLAIERGDVQMIQSTAEGAGTRRLADNPELTLTAKGYEGIGALNWLAFNLEREPLSDVRVRKAIATAIDKNFIAKALMAGFAELADGPIAPSSPFYAADDIVQYPFDLKKAAAMLDEAGYKAGKGGERFKLTIDYLPGIDGQQKNVAEYLRTQLKKVGITVDVRASADFPAWAGRLASHDFDLSMDLVYNWGDPVIGVARTYLSSNIRPIIWTNTQSYRNAEVDKLLAEAGMEIDPNKRKALYAKFQHIVTDELPIYYINVVPTYTITRKNVGNIPTTIWGPLSPFDEVFLKWASSMSAQTIIYRARRVRTMNPANPIASHVAVRDGHVLGAGSLDELAGWGEYTLDERFADKVLFPGLVEGHSHVMEGAFWRFVYVGYHDRMDPDGRIWPGARTAQDVLDRLSEEQAKLSGPDEPLTGWGFDPLFLDGQTWSREDLDRVSTSRPVGLMHASGHILNANTKALELAGLLRKGVDHPGLPLGADGLPTGECRGPDAMMPVLPKVGMDRGFLASDPEALRAFSKLCVRQGVTTATDLAAPMTPEAVTAMLAASGEPGFPTRIVGLLRFAGLSPEQLVERALELRAQSTERLRLGAVKMHADGSIQGFSARLRWPGYYNGAPNGLWYAAPEYARKAIALALANGVQIHTHTNGDEATEMILDAMQAALTECPVPDHRFTLQHCQLADAAQFRRMRALGMCVNLFANHTYYWGDAHYAQTVGPERAERMNACATAIASGVPFAIHSDAPITPIGPLFTAWCAVNRITSSGRQLGEYERIGVADALRAITLGAAYTLHLDGEIGSIETGKRADFAVLEADPMDVAPDAIKDVGVWGVVANGQPHAAADL